jgi:hypothetical protein
VGSSPTTGTTTLYKIKPIIWNREVLAYLIGVGLGDGSLSNPSGRATCLRISCDTKYPQLIEKFTSALNYILPESKVYLVKTPSRCVVLNSYSNYWEGILGWKVGHGSKFKQKVRMPDWIWCQERYVKACLRGLIETDGSIYYDRGYPMVMFVNIVRGLAYDVETMMKWLGFKPRMYNFIPNSKFNSQRIYHVRLSKNVQEFLNLVQPLKA